MKHRSVPQRNGVYDCDENIINIEILTDVLTA